MGCKESNQTNKKHIGLKAYKLGRTLKMEVDYVLLSYMLLV